MKAQIITIGNEILIGDIQNTNSSWLGEQLTLLGFEVEKMITVGDEREELLDVLQKSRSSSLVVVTGGLGPTHDDITKKTFQEFFKVGLHRDETVYHFVRQFFEKRGLQFTHSNEFQADVLDNAEVVFNQWGTAPGMWIREEKTSWLIMPGVPKEMKNIFTHQALVKISHTFPVNSIIKSAYLSVAGITESALSDLKLNGIANMLDKKVTLAYLPHFDGIDLRITVNGDSDTEVDSKISDLKAYIFDHAGDYVFSENKKPLGEVVGELLLQRNFTISMAESCTGGGVAYEMTHTPGCSRYFLGGIVSYSNEVKINQLGVKKETIEQFGAVSAETAFEMAVGVRKQLGTDIGISVTGIAGPDGGTEEKPVGLIWFGVSTPEESFVFKVNLAKDREVNRKRAIMIILDALRRSLQRIQGLPYEAEKLFFP